MNQAPRPDLDRGVAAWLLLVYLMIGTMIALGGITRLTGSGLSMVEWRPLMGALPPTSEAAWVDVFEQYKATPQFARQNHWMQMADFQRIFFWEYAHRLLGRVIGLVFLLPWLYFVVRKRLTRQQMRRTLLVFALGGIQGLLGWLMVQSGLVDRPQVSHYRLAAHLVLAFSVGGYVLWLLLDLLQPRSPKSKIKELRSISAFGALLLLQIVYGAFMAGTRAGYLFQTFPDMNGSFMPLTQYPGPGWRAALDDPVAIHFIHRSLGYVIVLAVVGFFIRSIGSLPEVARAAMPFLVGAIIAQFMLGVLTVVWVVPITIAAAHQVGAFVAFSALIWVAHGAGVDAKRRQV